MSNRRRKRVGPSQDDIKKIEVRTGRHLRVQHFNPRPRDEKFEHEMQMYIQYRQKGIPASGPFTMPRRQRTDMHKVSQGDTDQHHPLSVDGSSGLSAVNRAENTAADKGDNHTTARISTANTTQEYSTTNKVTVLHSSEEDGNAPSVASTVFSTPTHQGASENARSASSVQLAMHNQKQLQEYKSLPKSMNNIPDDIRESETEDNTNLHLNLSEVQEEESSTVNIFSPKTLHSPLTPPTAETKPNDASFYPSLFTKRQQSIFENAQSPDPDRPQPQCGVTETDTDKDLAIFFIHGVGGSADIWCAQTQYFSNLGYEIVAPDLIGHGFSCTPKDAKAYHFKEIAADLEELFDRFCKRRNILVGHSYGASFATLLARNRPRRVIRLVLISGGPPTPLAPQPGVFTLPYCMLACIKPCLTCGFYKGAFHKGRKPVISKEDAFNIPANVLQHIMNGQDWPDGDELFHSWLTCPSLLIYGAEDQLVSLSEEEEMAEVIFDSRLEVVKEASHMVMIEAPDEVNKLIHSFIIHRTETSASPAAKNNNASTSNTQIPPLTERSKSRKSLKSAKSQRSLPHHLLSKSITG